jgi:uncharacterized protein
MLRAFFQRIPAASGVIMRDALDTALKTAMKAQDKRRIATLRLVSAAIKDRDIACRGTGKDRVANDDILQLLAKMIKQREESARLYADAGREDLETQEREEIEIIREFLPRQLTDEEISAVVDEAIAAVDAAGVRDLGRVMAHLKEHHPGRMDFARASGIAKARLS